MMRNRFDEQLNELNSEMIRMGALCEEVIALAAKALDEGDRALAKKVAPLDTQIDQKERTIETLCLRLLLQQQPVARDLRQISAALKMITDMERIGDQAEDIAEIVLFLDGRPSEHNGLLQQMARAAITMVTNSVDAFVKRDTHLATQVVRSDDTVDRYFSDIKQSLITKISENPADGAYFLDCLMIAKYFERIADHSVNILESAEELKNKGISFSPAARQEYQIMSAAVQEVTGLAYTAFVTGDIGAARRIEPLEQVIDDLKEELRTRHIRRMQQGTCGIEAGFIWSDLLTDLERVSDHCSNIACCIVEGIDHNLHRHEVLQSIRENSASFDADYAAFREKYALAAE